ncbi:MAG: hypothetical protein AABX10_00600 [Nanoarchaeota archaeon]
MQVEKEEFVRKRKAEFNNYESLLKALIVLKKYLEENLNARYYFGGKLKKTGGSDQTPDIIIELNDTQGIIGEAKKSLRGLIQGESKATYLKNYVEGDLIKQLRKYDSAFDNFKVKEHDLVLLAPQVDSEALGIIKFDFLENNNNQFSRNFAILVYSIELQANTKRILIRHDYGKLSNENLFDKLRRGISYYEGQITKELSKYKVYEENEDATPLEYIMVILWDSIFNEIINSSDKEQIAERYRKKENKFQVNLSKLMDHLKRMYTLPTISIDGVNNNHRQQFKINSVRNAMEIFCHIGLANVINKNNGDILYEITLKILPEKDELTYFLNKIYDLIDQKKYSHDQSSSEKLDKYFVKN